MALATKTSAADWSIAYALTIRRLDSQFMLCLLRLDSWPNLSAMHGDLVEAMKLICALLEKRPMVGFLVAHRLKLPVDKTYALLSVLQTKGHIVTVGADLTESDSVNRKQISTLKDKPHLSLVGNVVDVDLSEEVNPKSSDSGDVLNQLWRVLNTDISWSKTANAGAGKDPANTSNKDAGDVLGQLWRVLNTEIANKRQADAVDGTVNATDTTIEANDKLSKLWRILDTEITLKKKSKTYVMKDAAGHSTKPAGQDTSAEAVSRLSQLWQVLNSEIAVTVPAERRAAAVNHR